jgi:hypothetical protein
MEHTAVDYFKDELIKEGFFIPGGIYAQAKAIERQKMIDAMMYTFYQQNTLPYGMEYIVKRDEMIENCIKYYNETYGTHE